MYVVANTLQKLANVLPASHVVGTQIAQANLKIFVLPIRPLLGRVPNPIAENSSFDCSLVQLQASYCTPDGRMLVSNKMAEFGIPRLTLIVGPWIILESSQVNIPQFCFEPWWYTLGAVSV